jgi:hypothetical protein
MAADRIVKVDVNSNLKEQTAQAKEFNKELEKAQKSSTKTGSRAADAALGVSTPGLGRGATGAGGRGGERDFARQAQGLGGLVHVYATFAANIYAVTAAFGALQKAADVSNLIRSADTLSSRYGVALKDVASQLKAITDQALSTEDALAFSAMGASAGVTSKQMEQLTLAATGASKALGRDLNDSMQRIFKGAIKLEPELLDELGIMVKLDDATREYARGLGKSALALTEYERRQAFVNAVIEQGNQKFSDAAKLSANPYTQLVASLKELQQEGLSVINLVLAPIAKLLAESPTALIAGVGILIAKLAKMAMPDLLPNAERRFEAASTAAEEASKKMKEANKQIAEAFEKTTAYEFISTPDQTKLVKKAADLGKKLKDSLALDIEMSTGKGPVKLSIDTEHLRKQYEASLIKAQKNAQTVLNRQTTSPKVRGEKEALIASLGAELKMVQALEVGLDKLANIEGLGAQARIAENIATTNQLKEQARLKVVQQQLEGKYIASLGTAWRAQREITKELVAQNAQMGGSNLRGFSVSARGFISSIGVVGKAAGTALLGVLGPIGMIAGGLSMLGGALYSVGKYFGIFTDKGAKVAEAAKSVKDNVDALNTSTSKLASATSFADIFELKQGNLKLINETVAAFKELTRVYSEFQKEGTTGDKTLDWVKDITPFIQSSGEAFQKGFVDTLKSLEKSGLLDQNKVKQSLLGAAGREGMAGGSLKYAAQYKSFEEFLRRAVDIGKTSPAMKKELNKLVLEMEATALQASSAAAGMAQVADATKELSNISKDYVTKLIPQTDLSKAQTQVIQGFLGAAANTEAATKFLDAFTTELSALGNINISSNIKEAKAAFDQLNIAQDAWRKSNLTDTEISQLTNARSKAIVAEFNLFGEYASFTVEFIQKASEMSRITARTEKSLALLNYQLRQLGTAESVFGPTEAGERKKQAIERQIIAAETEALQQQREQVSRLLGARASLVAKDLSTMGVKDLPESILSSTGGLDTLAQKINELKGSAVDPETLKGLVSAFDSISQLQLALYSVESKLTVVALKNKSLAEQNIALAKARTEQDNRTVQNRLDVLAKELEGLQASKAYYGTMSAGLSEIYTLKQGTVELAREELRLEQDLTNTHNKLLEQQTALKTGAFADYEDALKQLNALKEQYASLQRIDAAYKETRKTREELMKLDASDKLKAQDQERLANILSLQRALLDLSNDSYAKQASLLRDTSNTRLRVLKSEQEVLNNQLRRKNLLLQEKAVQEDLQAAAIVRAEISDLVIQKQLKLVEFAKEELEVRKQLTTLAIKAFEAAPSGEGFRKYMELAGEDFVNKLKDARAQAESVASTLNAGIINAVDSSIDTLMTGLMEGNLDWEEFGRLARNALAEAYRDAAAQTLKNAWKDIMTNLTGPTPEEQNKLVLQENTSNLLNATAASKELKLSLDTLNYTIQGKVNPLTGVSSIQAQTSLTSYPAQVNVLGSVTEDPSWYTETPPGLVKAGNEISAATEVQKEASDRLLTASDTAMLSSTMLLAFSGQWKQAAFMFLSQLMTTLIADRAAGQASSGIAAVVAGMFGFANGGVMSSYGPLKLNKYDKGGIASGPQLALYGEGRQNEAYVPLPDNRTIPVTLTGSSQGSSVIMGDTNISINIDSNGNADMTQDQTSEFSRMLALSVKKTVSEELVKHVRPGGLLYGAR